MLFYNQKTLTTNTEIKNIIKIFEEYQKVPNVPFLPQFTSKFIKYYLEKENVEYYENAYTIIINSQPTKDQNTETKKMVFMAHMDHPGIVIKDKENGIMMGLNEPKELAQFIDQNPIQIIVYSPNGDFLGKARITKFNNDSKQRVKIKSDFDIPKNSYGHFDAPRFSEDNTKIYGYNADDGIMISILLNTVFKKLESKYDIYFVFNKHEEVFQISSWNLARWNSLDIEEDDIIINLECLKTVSVNPDKYPVIGYENGPVLQLSNKGCLFGYKNPGPNFSELLVKKTAEKYSLPIQVGLINDSCDSRPFTQFGITSNICTITIPNKYKHDGADDGNIRPEEIYKKDVEYVEELLEKIVMSDPNNVLNLNTDSLSEKVKQNDDLTDENLMKYKKKINERLDIAYKDIVKRGYFYPEKFIDHISDFILKVVSYINYLFNKIR